MITQAEYIIGKFGGIHAMARAVRRAPTTVQGWLVRGTIPERRWNEILDAAPAARVEMVPEDFVAHIKAEREKRNGQATDPYMNCPRHCSAG